MAHWLKGRPEVDKVLHPALPDCPGHDNWKRQFKGASGLFSFTLRDGYSRNALAAMLDGMDIFGMGASWGGYESLMIPAHPDNTAPPCRGPRASTPARPYRAGGRRGSQDRPRRGLRAAEPGA